MTLLALFQAIVGAIKAVPIIDSWFSQIVSLYVTSMNQATSAKIVDAAALAARATNDDERYKAAKAWMDALSRPRIDP